ncbi:hypothetical protein OC861_000194 [Tilletia horrida]|nr:hypothetical protein OC861_000194 [Tilletia horrida]
MTAQAQPNGASQTLADAKSTAIRTSSSTRKRTSQSQSSARRSKAYPTKSGPATPAIIIIILLAAVIALAILSILIGPELYAFYRSQSAQSESSFTTAFATFLSLRRQERAAQNIYGKHLLRFRSALLNSTWAQEIHLQWANSILASIPPDFTPSGLQFPAYKQLSVSEHIGLLIVSPHTHLPWPLSILPGLFRLAAALSLSPIVLIGVADFAGYAVFRTLGLQRRRVRIKRTESPERKQADDYISAKPASTKDVKPVPFPRPNSGATSPRPGEAGGAPLLAPGTYDAEVLLRHRARSRSTSGTESADAEAEWARTGGQFARVSAVREAARRSSQEAQAQGVPPLTMPHASNNDHFASGSAGREQGGAHDAGPSPAPTHASLVSPPASPRTRFFRLRLPGVIGQEGALGMSDLTDFEDSGPESGTSSPVHSFSRASSISSGHGHAPAARSRHRPRIGGFTPLATPNEDDAGLRSLAPISSQSHQPPVFAASGAVASAHTSDGDSEDAGDESIIQRPSASLQPKTVSGTTMRRSKGAPSKRMPAHQSDLPPSAPTSPTVRRSQLPDPNVLSRTLRSLAGIAKSALTPGPMDPDAARLTDGSGGVAAGSVDSIEQDGTAAKVGGAGEEAGKGNSLGLDAGEPWAPAEGRPRRTSLFGDEEINYTYSGAGLVSGLRSADLEI